MKNIIYVILALAIITGCSACVGTDMNEVIIITPDLSRMENGEYLGRHDAMMVQAEVSVSMKSGKIEEITILEHNCGKGKPAEVITESVIEAQSLNVDTISSATYSSKVILKAIETALRN